MMIMTMLSQSVSSYSQMLDAYVSNVENDGFENYDLYVRKKKGEN